MRPSVIKRGAAAAGARRGGRVTRGEVKAQNTLIESAGEYMGKTEEASGLEALESKEEIPAEDTCLAEENSMDEQKPEDLHEEAVDSDTESNSIGMVQMKKEDEIKDSMDEYEKYERLDLDDNEPEYDPEEYGGEEYEEKGFEQEDVNELVTVNEEVEEQEEEIEVEEEGGDPAEDEIVDGQEELDSQGDDEHVGEEVGHVETVDAEEEEEQLDVFQERRKHKEFEIFVGGLDKDVTEQDLKKVFSQVGRVTEVRLVMNPQTKKNKGFAFLRFGTVEQAKRAVTELKNLVINGKKCGVSASQDSDTLFLGNICKTWTMEALREKLKNYGVENVNDVTLLDDSNREGLNRGFAFLEFSTRADAMDAYKRLQKKDITFGIERPAKVSFADSFIDTGDEIMAQVKTIFIDGLSPSWNEDHVRGLLEKYGKLEKVELACNMPSAKRRDFGFATFDSHEAAVICAKAINNSELGEGENKAKVRARLSRPVQRGGKGRRAIRSDGRPIRGTARAGMSSRARPLPRSLVSRSARGVGSRAPPSSGKKPIRSRDIRPVVSVPARSKPLPPPRSYDRRPPAPSYPKMSHKREYGRGDDLPPRSRATGDYSSRLTPERRPSYRDDYSSRAYPDLPRSTSRSVMRRPLVDDLCDQRFERPPSYSGGQARGYIPVPGSKRPYVAMDDISPRYADADIRHSRARLEYDISSPRYGEAYGGDRFSRPSLGYGSSRNSMSIQDSRGLYGSHHGMDYGGGSYGGRDVGGMYSSSYGGDYVSRRDVGGSSYSSLYSRRGMGGRSYSGGGPRSYY